MSKIIILSDEDCNTVRSLLQLHTVGKLTFEEWKTVYDIVRDKVRSEWPRLAELFEKAPSEHTIRIVVRGGLVEDVERMPMGFDYEVQDFDECSECGGVEPLCEFCLGESWSD